ncbi:hypothetical protein Pfo_004210, partial [Paulownia fortunei]
KIVAVLFLLLLLMAGEIAVALSINRKLMVDMEWEERVDSAAQAVRSDKKANQAAARESSGTAAAASAAEEPEIKNHHTIPRESWDSGQNQNGPAADVQNKDGTSADNHA